MKYLKYMNEKLKSEVESDLIRIADDSMPYLYDEGYYVWANSQRWGNTKKSTTFINLAKKSGNSYTVFKWEDIKDTYITFIQYISDIYEIDKVQITLITNNKDNVLKSYHYLMKYGNGFINNDYTFEDVVNDNIADDKLITQINLYVNVVYEK